MKHVLFLLLATFSFCAFADNLHLIHSAPNGYAMYRSGKPDAADMKKFCDLGITEIMVLSGTADEYERKLEAICPTLKVIYNVKQKSSIPLDTNFLESFDAWVQSSQAAGKKIAFRCSCGCHRTGRLAAYYEMKYKGLPLKDVLGNMNRIGKYMYLFPGLIPQVYALRDYMNVKPCSVPAAFCVQGAVNRF